MEAFKCDLNEALNIDTVDKNVEAQANFYNDCVISTLDKHAPLRTKISVIRTNDPWYNSGIRAEKIKRRKAEKKWRNSGLTIHKEIFHFHRNKVTKLIKEAKIGYYQNKISENAGNQKELFSITNTLLNRKETSPLPSYDSPKELADRMADYFEQKIDTIRQGLKHINETNGNPDPHTYDTKTKDCTLSEFIPATQDELKKIIMSFSNKSCELDPLPTDLLKQCIDVLVPCITNIVNASLASGTMPLSLKNAIVCPLLKKNGFDSEVLTFFRPVSNLSFLSKLIENVELTRLNAYNCNHNLNQ